MAHAYDEAESHAGSWVLVRRGRGPHGKFEMLLGLGLVGLFLTFVFAPAVPESPFSFAILIVGAALLSIAAYGFGLDHAFRSVLISDPPRVELEPPELRIGQRSLPTSEVVRLEIHKVPVGGGRAGPTHHHYVVGIVLRSHVIELTFSDLDHAQNVAYELVARLGVGEVIVRSRSVTRTHGCLLVLPVFLAVLGECGIAMWMMVLGPTHLQALLMVGLMLSINLAAFLLTWWWGAMGAKSYLAIEYAAE